MGGIVGRMFREFAITLSAAVAISLLVSLTTTPAMCAKLLKSRDRETKHNRVYQISERGFQAFYDAYAGSLRWVLKHQRLVLAATLATVCLAVYLYLVVPKGFFPAQDTGVISGNARGPEEISFQSMREKMMQYAAIVQKDPAVSNVHAFISRPNQADFTITLKPLSERNVSVDQVINRLRPQLARVVGANLFLRAVRDVDVGGRVGNSEFQYTLQGDNLPDLLKYSPTLEQKLRALPLIRDVNTDLQNRGLQAGLVIDRDTAGRLGISASTIDSALYDAFGQRQVSTIYKGMNQYHVVMEVDPQFQVSPQGLNNVFVPSSSGKLVPLSAFTHYESSSTSLAVAHQGQFPAVTFTFNLAPNIPLGDAVSAVQKIERDIGLPATIHPGFQGTAQAFQDSLASEPFLIPRRWPLCTSFWACSTKITSTPSQFSLPCPPPGWVRCWRFW